MRRILLLLLVACELPSPLTLPPEQMQDEVLIHAPLSFSTDEDSAITLELTGAASVETSALTGALVHQGGASYRYTPAFDALKEGDSAETTFTVVYADGSATATIHVAGKNDAPVATADVVALYIPAVLTIDVLSNDTDAEEDPLTLTSVDAPAELVDGRVKFTTYDEGTVTVSYTVEDATGATATGTLTITSNAHGMLPFILSRNSAPIGAHVDATWSASGACTLRDGETIVQSPFVVTESTHILELYCDQGVVQSYHAQAFAPVEAYFVDAAIEGGDGLSWETAYQTIEAALAVAGEDAVSIRVKTGEYHPEETLVVHANNRIYGGFDGVTVIAADANKRAMQIAGSHVVLESLTIDNGQSASRGAGLLAVDVGDVSLKSIVFSHNDVSSDSSQAAEGGAAYFENVSQLSLAGCSFFENTANGAGFEQGQTNGSAAHGGALALRNTTFVISSSVFASNAARGGTADAHGSYDGGEGAGGAIYAMASTGSITTTELVSGNAAFGGLGGAAQSGSSNQGGAGGSGFGGAIALESSDLSFASCSMSSNGAVAAPGGAGTPVGLPGGAFGGALFLRDSTAAFSATNSISGNMLYSAGANSPVCGGAICHSLSELSGTETISFAGNDPTDTEELLP